MKRLAIYLSIFIGLGLVSSCTTRVVVRERPAEVVYERPPAPTREHIWISGDWVWEGGAYRWHEGHWEARRVGYVWVGGHWQEVRGGWRWVPGHWRAM